MCKAGEMLGIFRKTALERILDRLVGVTARGCWLWQGQVSKDGYGFIEVRLGLTKRRYKVYRLLYEYYRGKPPFGQVLRHTCDVRRCINPDHLVPGSKKQNTADMVRAGRAAWQQPKGTIHLRAIEDNSDPVIEHMELPPPPIRSRRNPSSWWKTPK